MITVQANGTDAGLPTCSYSPSVTQINTCGSQNASSFNYCSFPIASDFFSGFSFWCRASLSLSLYSDDLGHYRPTTVSSRDATEGRTWYLERKRCFHTSRNRSRQNFGWRTESTSWEFRWHYSVHISAQTSSIHTGKFFGASRLVATLMVARWKAWKRRTDLMPWLLMRTRLEILIFGR